MVTILKRAVAALAVIALLSVAWTTTGVQGGFTAKVTNTQNSVGSGTTFVSATAGHHPVRHRSQRLHHPSTTAFDCASTTATLPTQTPAGSRVTTSTSANSTVTAAGTISPGTATYQLNSCGVVQLANSIAATNPLLVRGTVQFAQAAKWSDAGALQLDGTSALGTSVTTSAGSTGTSATVGDLVQSRPRQRRRRADRDGPLRRPGHPHHQPHHPPALPRRQRQRRRRRTTPAQSAPAPESSSPPPASTTATTAGISPPSPSPPAATKSTVLKLYVDGAQLKTSTTNNGVPVAVTGNYWHIGWADISGTTNWSGSTALTNYFPGSLSNAFIDDTALDGSISSFNSSGSQANLEQQTGHRRQQPHAGPSATTAQQTYTGTLPGSAANPCTAINVIVDDTANPSCVYPSTPTTACPALGNTRTLQTLVAAGTLTLKASIPQPGTDAHHLRSRETPTTTPASRSACTCCSRSPSPRPSADSDTPSPGRPAGSSFDDSVHPV